MFESVGGFIFITACSICLFAIFLWVTLETSEKRRPIKKTLLSKYTGVYYYSLIILKITEPIDEDS